jgi:hypothetical protein
MKNIQNFVIVTLIALIGYLYFFRKPGIKYIPSTHTEYITDTFRLRIPYPIPIPYHSTINPVTVKIYLKDSLAIDSLELLLKEKDILIQGLHSQIIISQDFLKQYPRNPKLIELNLKSDSLSLSMLGIDGIPMGYSYPIYLSDYKYKWTLNNLSYTKTNDNNTIKNPLQFWIGSGFNFIYPTPYLNFAIEKNWARIRIYGETNIGLLKKEGNSLNMGLKYNLSRYGFN